MHSKFILVIFISKEKLSFEEHKYGNIEGNIIFSYPLYIESRKKIKTFEEDKYVLFDPFMPEHLDK